MRRLALDLNGGANEIRTHDLCSAIAALSQLSYGPFRSHLVAGRDTCQGKRVRAFQRNLGRELSDRLRQCHGRLRPREITPDFAPRAALILPPVARLEAGGLCAFPFAARQSLRLLVAVIEKADDARESPGSLSSAVSKRNSASARLGSRRRASGTRAGGSASPSRAVAVRQKGFVAISPERGVDGVEPLGRGKAQTARASREQASSPRAPAARLARAGFRGGRTRTPARSSPASSSSSPA